jgi:hypothetical protein
MFALADQISARPDDSCSTFSNAAFSTSSRSTATRPSIASSMRASVTRILCPVYSNEKMRFQSFFMLITVQARDFASSMSAWVNVPTLLSGSPPAGP